MGNPAYYINVSPPESPVSLPVTYDPTSNEYAVTREQIQLATGRGVMFEYELYTRRTPIFIFTLPASQLASFKTMHDAVVGGAFYFIPDGDVPSGAIHVRKDPNFLPEPIGMFVSGGNIEQWFRYELRLIEEITAADIED